MIDLAVVAAICAVVGGVVAVGARGGWPVAGGLIVAMVAAPLAATPEPTSLTIAFRIVGALLAGYLLWIASRPQAIGNEGSAIGLPAASALAAAAFAIGWLVAPVKPLAGPPAAQAAGISLVAIAMGPLSGRDVLRSGTAFASLTLGFSLLFQAWVGPATAAEGIVVTAVLVGMIGATSLLVAPPVTLPMTVAPGAPEAEPSKGSEDAENEGASEPAFDEDGLPGDAEPAPARAAAVRTPNPRRVSRTASPRALRQAAPRGTPTTEQSSGAPPESPEVPFANPMRRLRPREPRR